MVSPWKRIARWISPRPAADQEDPSTDGLDVRVSALPQPADRGQTGLPLPEETELRQADGDSLAAANPDPSQPPEAASRWDVREEVTGPAVPPDPVASSHDDARSVALPAAPPQPAGRASGSRRSDRSAGKPAAVQIRPQLPLPDSMHSAELELDEEIRVLRSQLAEKLQQQNQQLKKMLERFL